MIIKWLVCHQYLLKNLVNPCMLKTTIYFFLLLFCSQISFGNSDSEKKSIPYHTLEISLWADSVLNTLSVEQKIGQLFMIAGNGKGLTESYYKEIDNLLLNYQLGGVIFFQSGPHNLKKLAHRYNTMSSMPLLVGMDAEWGVSMRLDSAQAFPWMMTLGAIQDNALIYQFGSQVARECKELGVHMNFAPVVDINNNPSNPIIDRRSFGSVRELVSDKGLAYMQGMQDYNILACAKHFPGHGDTDTDSHKSLPVLLHSRDRLDSLELFPFSQLIHEGLGAIMIAHMNLPNIDTLDIPSSFSNELIFQILKKDMGFNGLVISDALNMRALSNYTRPGEVELNAFLAGNDILLYPQNVPEGVDLIKSAVLENKILEERLNHSCKQILMIKKWVGLFNSNQKVVSEFKLTSDSSRLLNRTLSSKAITLLKNQNNIIPISLANIGTHRGQLLDKKVATVLIGPDVGNVFHERLNHYLPIPKYQYSHGDFAFAKDSILQELSLYDVVIVGMHYPNNNFWEKHQILEQDLIFLKKLSEQNQVIVNLFGHPRLINEMPIENIESLILSYQNTHTLQDLTAQLIFGSISAEGVLPLSLDSFPSGHGLRTDVVREFSFVLPIEVAMDSETLQKIDTLVLNAIQNRVLPGCQIVASRNGKIFYNKSFGYQTYDSLIAVQDHHLYDLASITKIAAAAPIIMKLVDSRSISLKRKLKRYTHSLNGNVLEYRNTNKSNMKMIDVFTHQAQLFPWIPFYKETLDSISVERLYSTSYSLDYKWKVASNLYLKNDYRNNIFNQVFSSELLSQKEYRYSDLGFYLIQPLIEKKIFKSTSLSIDQYVYSQFYHPIEAFRITYNPLDYFEHLDIVPTEKDIYFRNQLIRGYVHDQGAALLGGVALHAGLFSNAVDLTKLMQLYLNEGRYLNNRLFSKKTMSKFTSAPFLLSGNRRGIIFDKPSIDPNENGPTCDSISFSSFGHSGFTGTFSWVDPYEKITYVFLSNARSYPDGNNIKLLEQNIRTDIQKIIYQSIIY